MWITGILSQKNESAEDVRYSVKSIIKESGCDITEALLDCTHRVGKNDSFRKNVRLVIARFTTFMEQYSIKQEVFLKLECILI